MADARGRYRRRHARRVARFFEQAALGRANMSREPLLRWIDSNSDEWMRIAERNRAGVV